VATLPSPPHKRRSQSLRLRHVDWSAALFLAALLAACATAAVSPPDQQHTAGTCAVPPPPFLQQPQSQCREHMQPADSDSEAASAAADPAEEGGWMAAARAAVDGGGSEAAAGEAAGGSAGDSGDEPAAELDAGHVAALQQLARSVLGNLQQLLAAPAQHTGGFAADTSGGSDETDAGEPAAGEGLDVHLLHADADEADAEADAAGSGQPAQQQQTLAQALQAAVHLAENAAEFDTRPPKNVSKFSTGGQHQRRYLACSCRCARHLAISL